MKTLIIDPKRINLDVLLVIPNLGLGYMTTAMRRAGHETAICNAARDSIMPREVARLVEAGGFGLAGITIFTPYFNSAAMYFREIRKRCPGVILVAGGPHVIFEPAETLKMIPEVDFAVSGEGEETLPALASLLENKAEPSADDFDKIPNLAYRTADGGIRLTPHKLIEDIKPLDFAAWDQLEPHKFPLMPNGIFTSRREVAPINTARGCPYQCTFCGAQRSMGGKVRHRDPDSVVDEIEMLNRDYGIREIHMMDDNFAINREKASEICRKLAAKHLDVVWSCPPGVRLDCIDDELLGLMSRSGCYSTSVGIESGTQRVLDLMKKKMDLGIVESRLEMLKRNNIKTTGLFVLGIPGETVEEMNETVRLSMRLKIDRANYFVFTPFPGSALYDELKSRDRLGNLDYDNLLIHHICYCGDSVPFSTLAGIQKKAYLGFYLRPKVLFNLVKEIHSIGQLKTIANRAIRILFPGKNPRD